MTAAETPYAATVSEFIRPVLTVVTDDLPDAGLSVDELGSRIVGLAGRLASATCRWLLLVAAFDARGGAARFGLGSTGRWLTHYCGVSARTAREHVRVARMLAAHPMLVEAMDSGRISYSKLRAIGRVAELGDQQFVQDLVMVAEHGSTGQLEDVVRGLRSVADNEDSNDATAPNPEAMSYRWRDDTRWALSARLDPEHGALVQSALETLARQEGLSRAQALTRMAEIVLATGGLGPSLRGDEYAAIVIHLDAAAVPTELNQPRPPDGHPAAKPRVGAEGGPAEPHSPRPSARVAGGPGLPAAIVERLLCSGRIRTVVTTGGTDRGDGTARQFQWRAGVLDVGANRRLVSNKQFRALLIRDGGCAHPGCGSPIGLEAHHVRHWIYGGKTIMANLVLLCRRHHHSHHDGEFSIVPSTVVGRFRFLRADGRELPAHITPSTLAGTEVAIENEHPHVAANAATTRWDGSRLDRDYAVAVLAPGLRGTPSRGA